MKYYGAIKTTQTYICCTQAYMTMIFLSKYVKNYNSGCFRGKQLRVEDGRDLLSMISFVVDVVLFKYLLSACIRLKEMKGGRKCKKHPMLYC